MKRPKGREQLLLTNKVTLPKGFQDSVMEMLNMVCSCRNGELCIDYFHPVTKQTTMYGCRGNDKANNKTQDHTAIDFHSTTSAEQYEYTVLEAYGIAPVARKEQTDFVLCGNEMKRKDCRGNKTISVFATEWSSKKSRAIKEKREMNSNNAQ